MQTKTILIAILAVLVVALAGVLGYQKLTQPETTPIVANQPVVQNKDETAGWKVYKNEQYGFEIKYPNDWKILHEGYYKEDVPYEISFSPTAESVGSAPISILVSINNFESIQKVGGYDELVSEKDINFNNIVSKFQIMNGPEGEVARIIVPLKTDLNYIFGYGNAKYKEIFDQMLSTFKFFEII